MRGQIVYLLGHTPGGQGACPALAVSVAAFDQSRGSCQAPQPIGGEGGREARSRLAVAVTMSIDMRGGAGRSGAAVRFAAWLIWTTKKKKKKRSVGLNASSNCVLRADPVDGYGNKSDKLG